MPGKVISLDEYRKARNSSPGGTMAVVDGHLASAYSFEDPDEIWKYLGANFKLRPEHLRLLRGGKPRDELPGEE